MSAFIQTLTAFSIAFVVLATVLVVVGLAFYHLSHMDQEERHAALALFALSAIILGFVLLTIASWMVA